MTTNTDNTTDSEKFNNVIKELQKLAAIGPAQKYNTKSKTTTHSTGLFQWLDRMWYGEDRHGTELWVKDISKDISIVSFLLYDVTKSRKLKEAIESSLPGLNNLKDTYTSLGESKQIVDTLKDTLKEFDGYVEKLQRRASTYAEMAKKIPGLSPEIIKKVQEMIEIKGASLPGVSLPGVSKHQEDVFKEAEEETLPVKIPITIQDGVNLSDDTTYASSESSEISYSSKKANKRTKKVY